METRTFVRYSLLVLCILTLLYSHVIFYQTTSGLSYNQSAGEYPSQSNGKCVQIVENVDREVWDCYPIWNFSGISFRPPFSGSEVTFTYPDNGLLDDLNSSY